jgi:RsiW-degrading membrane proteinase PrsW (M82 family)
MLAGVGLGGLVAPVVTIAILGLLGRPATLPGELALAGDAVAPVVAQVVKGALLLLLIRVIRDEFDDLLDGIVYGAAIGAGFGAAQSVLFFAGGENRLDPPTLLLLLVAGLNQAFYGATFGAIVAFARRLRSPVRSAIVIGLGLATSALLDALHDTLPNMLARVAARPDASASVVTQLLAFGVNLLGLATLAVVVWLAWGRERRIIRAELDDEASSGLVPPDELARIASQRDRLSGLRQAYRRGGWPALRAQRRLDHLEAELAFQKWRRRVRGEDRVRPGSIDELRDQVAGARRRLEELTA